MKKIVLAYSGGLDTSCCIAWLTERDFEVHAYLADVGQGADFSKLKKRALKAGVKSVVVDDLKEDFARDYVLPTLKAGAVYESKYYLATALSRPLIAKGLVGAAKRKKADWIAHGCTGKGNDQVRFEVSVGILNPKLKIMAPLRVWNLVSREQELEYAKAHGIAVDVTKKSPYSIDRNLWGMSIECGVLEDPWVAAPNEIWQIAGVKAAAPKKPTILKIGFEKGSPVSLNGKRMKPVKLIQNLNQIGSKYGLGRTDLVENRLVGIKSREVYVAPAAVILHTAHEGLENLVLDRETFHFKKVVALRYAELVYYGLWFTPLKEALDKFVEATQGSVTGVCKVKISQGACEVAGRKSSHSLYKKELATYGDEDKFDHYLAEGFIKLWGLPYRKKL